MRYLSEDDIDYLMNFYPSNGYNNSFQKASEMIADRFFRCPSMDLAKGLTLLNSTVYKYRWNYSSKILRLINFHNGTLGLGFHFSEIPFLFSQRATYIEKEEQVLSDTLIRAWTSFASSGTPEMITARNPATAGIKWPPYNIITKENIVFQSPVKDIYVEEEFSRLKTICPIWSKLESKRPYVRDFY